MSLVALVSVAAPAVPAQAFRGGGLVMGGGPATGGGVVTIAGPGGANLSASTQQRVVWETARQDLPRQQWDVVLFSDEFLMANVVTHNCLSGATHSMVPCNKDDRSQLWHLQGGSPEPVAGGRTGWALHWLSSFGVLLAQVEGS